MIIFKQQFHAIAIRLAVLLALLLVFIAPSQALEPLLPQQQAFAVLPASADEDMLHLHWNVADGYYLYQEKFVFESLTPGISLGQAIFPAGTIKEDQIFGKMRVFRGQTAIDIPYSRDNIDSSTITLQFRTQGCEDRGVCYAPHEQILTIELPDKSQKNNYASASKAGLFDRLSGLSESLTTSIGQRLGLTEKEPFLPPDKAYILSVDVIDDQTVGLHWDIAEGYYLYRDKIQATVIEPAGILIEDLKTTTGEIKEDEYFGKMEVYHQQAEATLNIQRNTINNAIPLTLDIAYQGCAEAGFCYPPINKQMMVTLPAFTSTTASAKNSLPNNSLADSQLSEQDRIAGKLASDGAILTALGLFGVGLLLAFTPCVFPMIPILSSIIVGEGESVTTRRAFTLSLVYVLAMAFTYTLAGVFAGLFGQNLQALFQSPWSIIPFSLLFVVLALSMYGFYELQLPAAWQSRLNEISNQQKRGKYFGAAIMGCLSALIVGPCVAAPLAGVLIYIGLSGDALTGGFSLFMMSLGMGLPLLVVGTSAGRLMPRVGPWMTAIKIIFGVMLLGMAVWLLERIIPGPISLLLWALLLIGSAIYMGALSRYGADANGWKKLWQALGLAFLVYGVILIVGAASGGDDILQPLKGLRSTNVTSTIDHLQFKRVKGLTELQNEIQAASQRSQAVMLDFYADWCIDCKKLERTTFADPDIIKALANVHLIQADLTMNDAQDQALLKHYGLFGPPAILFFNIQGQEVKQRRLVGFLDKDDFIDHIHKTFP